jgi:hypothetical protein
MSDLFRPFRLLVAEWLARARDREVEDILSVVRDELRRRGRQPCESGEKG